MGFCWSRGWIGVKVGGLWGGFLKTSTMWGLVWGFAIRGLVVQKVVDNCGKVGILLGKKGKGGDLWG